MKKSQKNPRWIFPAISTFIFASILTLLSFAKQSPQQIFAQAVTPTVYCLGACPTTVPTAPSGTTTVPTSGTGTTPATTTEPSTTGNQASPSPTINPCENTTVSVTHRKHHKKRHGWIGKFFKWLLEFLIKLLEKWGMEIPSGGGSPEPSVSPSEPEPTTQPGEPTEIPEPTVNCDPTETPEEPTTEPTTGTVSPSAGANPTTGPTVGNAPADPAANATVKNLLSNMYKYKGKFLLSGQMDGDQGQDEQANLAARNGGVYAAVHGYDWAVGGVTAGNATTYLNKMISEWNQYKVIPTVSSHWTPNQATETPPGCGVIKNPVSMTDVMNPSTAVGARYADWKKNFADDFTTLQAAGVPVLFRPFHEAGNSCFWWNQGSTADYVNIWKDTFNYMTNTRGLHNIIWVFNSNGPNVSTAYYPGDSYVDIIGGDNYTITNGDFSGDYKLYQGFSANKLVALPEVASVPDLSKWSAFPVVFEMTWSGSFLAEANTDAQLQTFFAAPQVINRSTVSKYVDGSLQ